MTFHVLNINLSHIIQVSRVVTHYYLVHISEWHPSATGHSNECHWNGVTFPHEPHSEVNWCYQSLQGQATVWMKTTEYPRALSPEWCTSKTSNTNTQQDLVVRSSHTPQSKITVETKVFSLTKMFQSTPKTLRARIFFYERKDCWLHGQKIRSWLLSDAHRRQQKQKNTRLWLDDKL